MADERIQPYLNCRYSVGIDGYGDSVAGFSEVSGFDATFDVVEYREGNMEPTPMKTPGLMKYGNITMKHGVTNNTALYDWLYNMFNENKMEVHNITIALYSAKGEVAASWQIINAWPVKYTAPDFNASSSEIAFETIEFAHEGLRRLDTSDMDSHASGSGSMRAQSGIPYYPTPAMGGA